MINQCIVPIKLLMLFAVRMAYFLYLITKLKKNSDMIVVNIHHIFICKYHQSKTMKLHKEYMINKYSVNTSNIMEEMLLLYDTLQECNSSIP